LHQCLQQRPHQLACTYSGSAGAPYWHMHSEACAAAHKNAKWGMEERLASCGGRALQGNTGKPAQKSQQPCRQASQQAGGMRCTHRAAGYKVGRSEGVGCSALCLGASNQYGDGTDGRGCGPEPLAAQDERGKWRKKRVQRMRGGQGSHGQGRQAQGEGKASDCSTGRRGAGVQGQGDASVGNGKWGNVRGDVEKGCWETRRGWVARGGWGQKQARLLQTLVS